MTTTFLSEVNLTDILRHCVDGLFVIDRNRRCTMFSEACERITGYDQSSMIGTECTCHETTDCNDEQGQSLAEALCPTLSLFEGEVPSVKKRMSLRHREGHLVWVETTYSPILDEHGNVTNIVGIMRDISDLRDQEEDLHQANMRMAMDPPQETPAAQGCPDLLPSPADETSTDAQPGPLDRMLTRIEKREILTALQRSKGQRTLAARLLGISRSRLYRRMEALAIDPRKLGFPDEH